ncbi:MAG: Tetratricopeptide repeat protein, partial [Verrucomicrobia bacterium]|nr:Tetratricopeptide repeat protein [Verrucomicrobiota bacterium]
DALRAFGIEVWFDQSELRGGDAWDAKIKRQIRECALFVPIVSAHTQARGEGYFRREWKLAVERTHDMAAGVPFLMPIVIDDTLESEALVPDEVMRVQWTRMPHGVPTPQFVEQVKRLMENPRKPAAQTARSSRPAHEPPAAPIEKKNKPAWTVGMVVAVAVGISTALWVSRKHETPAAPAVAPAKTETAAPGAPAVSDKSIAVLPFTNMSEEKDSAFFTDGMHEDILTNLALIRELRVVSRTSVMQYRDTKKPIGQVAKELGVAYVLEGSVRRSGNKVRVTGQLIHGATDEHVWAKSYDRDLTDIFAIQAELSQQIAGALKAALSPEEKVQLSRRPTENTVAYDLFLQARDISNRLDNSTINRRQREKLLENAVELDPAFAQAWGDLADVFAFAVFTFESGMDDYRTKAKSAIDRAVKLAPDDTDVIRSLGTYYYYANRDYVQATEQYEKLARRQPSCSLWESSADVASSRIRIGALRKKARARARRCFCPPESREPRSPTTVS